MSGQTSLQKSRPRCAAFLSTPSWARHLKPNRSKTELRLSCGVSYLRGIAGSCGSPVFKCLGSQHTLLHSSRPILHSHQPRVRVPLSPHPRQHLLLPGFLYFHGFVLFWNSSPNGCEVAAHCGFDQQFGASFHAFITSSLEKCLFNSGARVLIRLLGLLLLSCSRALDILGMTPYQIRGLQSPSPVLVSSAL